VSPSARVAIVLGIVAHLAVAPACKTESENRTIPIAPSPLEDTRWRLVEIDNQPLNMPAGADEPYIQLLKPTKRLEGFAGCNRIMGAYELDGQSLRFPGVGATRKHCQSTAAIEQAFLTALTATGSYEIVGNRLELRGDTTTVARLEAW
jgi:heat shock protein HslJ